MRWWSFLRTASSSRRSRRHPGLVTRVQGQDLLVSGPRPLQRGVTSRRWLARLSGVTTGWDNTARRGNAGHVFRDATPEHYEVWLRRLLDYTRRHHHGDHRLLFVNAWNEWGEGTYLEPDEKFGTGFLEATARAVFGVPTPAALIATLRQMHRGDDEAHSALDQLAHGIRINEQIVNLVDARGTDPGRRITRRLLGAIPPARARRRQDAPADHLQRRGRIPRRAQLTELRQGRHAAARLRRAADGMDRRQGHRSRLQLTHPVPALQPRTGDRYVAQVLSRTRRDDVVAHLKSQRAYRHMSEACALYSGYRAYLNIAAVAPGRYKLDAIVPEAGGRGAAMLSLHSSITVR